jgi:hypothetical protein
MFSDESKIRKSFYSILTNRKFEIFIILVIILSSIELAINGPLQDPNSSYSKKL